eukprot:NODE_63_length_26141_cov_1.022656.p21 type:complete len:163 gc:universal NODE_63_length_26141_cov_1.022656:11892-11404(-)
MTVAIDTLNDNPFAAQKKHAVMFISHLPKGFEDSALKSYFSQFGKVLKVKVARNPQTLKSRHYGWICFEEDKVAEIAAETMNNYILGDRVLKCQILTDDEIHDGLFKQYNVRKMKSKRVSTFKSKRKLETSEERRALKISKYENLQTIHGVDLSTVISALKK